MFDFIKENPILCLIIFLLIVSPSFLFGAIQVFAIIFLVLILLVVIGLLTFRWKVTKLQKEANRAYGDQAQFKQQQQDDPTVRVYPSSTGKKVADDVGDYVEFEEVKEK